MIFPAKLHRTKPGVHVVAGDSTGVYEVFTEMTEMWWQAHEACMAAGHAAETEAPNVARLSEMAAKIGAREAWAQAIAVYAGWNGTELEKYLASVESDKKEEGLDG